MQIDVLLGNQDEAAFFSYSLGVQFQFFQMRAPCSLLNLVIPRSRVLFLQVSTSTESSLPEAQRLELNLGEGIGKGAQRGMSPFLTQNFVTLLLASK